MSSFLESSLAIDFEDPAIQEIISLRGWRSNSPEEQVEAIFLFVRDEIAHSYDAQNPRVTFRASECLQAGAGLCYSKSHLLAALLRALGFPTAIRYQRLRLPTGDFCLHAFNSIQLDGRWLDVDARGNNAQVETEFSLFSPSLAFAPDAEKGERTYVERFAEPPPSVCEALCQARNALTMRLPDTVAPRLCLQIHMRMAASVSMAR